MKVSPLRRGWQTRHNRWLPENEDFGRTILLDSGYKIDIWEADDGIYIELAGNGTLAISPIGKWSALRIWRVK